VPRPWSIAPYFIVDDVVATADFYRDTLVFHYERFRVDPEGALHAEFERVFPRE
jgi:hypothetical protein